MKVMVTDHITLYYKGYCLKKIQYPIATVTPRCMTETEQIEPTTRLTTQTIKCPATDKQGRFDFFICNMKNLTPLAEIRPPGGYL